MLTKTTLKKKPVKNSDKVSVTFECEASPETKDIHLVGDFNAWEPSKTPLKKRKDGSWSVAVRLQKDQKFEFCYIVDGSDWLAVEGADGMVRNPFGGQNSIVEV